MKATDFTDKYKPMRLQNGPMVFVKDTTARWVIANPSQRLNLDAIAKDVRTMDELVFPICDKIQVLDLVVRSIYSISVDDFERYAIIRNYGHQQQYFVWRRYWIRTPLEAINNSKVNIPSEIDAPVQPRLFDTPVVNSYHV